MVKSEHKVVVVSVILGILIWIFDGVIDALIFTHGSFVDSFMGGISAHEFYFRTFFVICIILFGMVTSGMLEKRRRAEKELTKAIIKIEEEKAKSEAIISAIGDGVSIHDTAFRVLYQNQVHKNLIGEHIGEYCYRAYARSDTVCPGCPAAAAFRDGEIHSLEKTVPKDGGARSVEIKASPLRDFAGNIIASIEVVRDITEHKRVEAELLWRRGQLEDLVRERTVELITTNEKLQQEIDERKIIEEELLRAQKLESLGILAGGIAHDFNNFLAAIMGNISLAMLDMNPGDAAYRQLVNAENASLRARDLTQQLLTFSKGGEPVKTALSLGGLVKEAAGFSLRGSRVRCEISIPAELWLTEADEGQMTQVMNNLLINADHAMPQGGIITVTGENAALGPNDVLSLNEGNYVKISVHDRGIGIPREHLLKVFDPYFTTKQKGSGLGLATSYSIIKKHNGHITVESELGVGTAFHIYLPASEAPAATRGVEQRKLLVGTGRILLMDDEKDVRETSGDMLRRLGYEVEFAEDGGQAIALYRTAGESKKPFDAVIMDLTVAGGMGGKEAIQKLRELDPNVRAIVSSGYSKDPVMADYKGHGFSGVVAKPYRIRDLGEVVCRVLNTVPPGINPASSENRREG